MEIILGILAFIFIPVAFRLVLNLIGHGTVAAGRAVKQAVTGKETYFGPAQLKFVDETNDELGLKVKKIMFRGMLPIPRDMNISYSLSAFDTTDGKNSPVLSYVDAAQEENSTAFQVAGDLGRAETGTAFTDWVQLGAIIPEIIQPPHSGRRNIQVTFRMYNSQNPPNIYVGFVMEEGELVLSKELSFSYEFTEKGYEEASQDREEAQAISLKIGVVVAMADGSLDDAEGEVLKNWIVKEIAAFSESKQDQLKDIFNNALKEGFDEAKKGTLTLSSLVERLSEIGDKKTKYDAIELCFDVMAADGIADPEEMSVIRSVASSLELDMDEIEKMREKVTLDLSSELTSEEGIESLVGIEHSWSNEDKRKHLRSEFQKWSNRIGSLAEGDERIAAQNMLDNIASLRTKYD
jgi:tellurite resistance protein